jgi:hypothetical protein
MAYRMMRRRSTGGSVRKLARKVYSLSRMVRKRKKRNRRRRISARGNNNILIVGALAAAYFLFGKKSN